MRPTLERPLGERVSSGTPRVRVESQDEISRSNRRNSMKTTFKIAIAAALLAGATSLAMAQMNNPNSPSSSTAGNAAASGGPGTHQVGGPKTGSASNTEKVMKNKNGYDKQQ
jgi:hypothetical protein